MEKTSESGIKRNYAAVTVVAILNNFKTVAQLNQEIVVTYPGRRMNSDKSTGLFVGAESGPSFKESRTCLVPVPAGTTVEQVSAQLLKHPNGCIQRVRSNNLEDILTKGDYWAVSQGLMTMEDLSDKHETRDTAGNKYSQNELRVDVSGKVIDASLPIEYSRKFYQNAWVEDQDLRDAVPAIALVEEREAIVS